MKKGKYILIIFLIFFILLAATFVSFLYYEFAKPPSVKSGSCLEIDLSGEIEEKSSPHFLSLFYSQKPPLSMYDVWTNIRKAKVDPRIDSVLLRLGYLQCDWAKVNEIREMVLDFRKSGKKVYAYIEESYELDKEYYLASACDQVILHPEGILIINGIGGYIPFVKKMLDKIGIKAEVERVEEYKTAYNMFAEDRLTPAHREMMESLYQEIFSTYVDTVSQEIEKTPQEFKGLLSQAFFLGRKAKEAGLVDEVFYEDELWDLISGKDTQRNRISHSRYLKTSSSSLGLNRGQKIALIYGIGPILTGEGAYSIMGSRTVTRWIRKARKDSSVKAIVFRVDSPGGSAAASDSIWREISLAKKKKPVVVSMSDLAGSGGYQVSMAAHKIVAHPQTLTGSIGVIFAKFNMENFYKKVGISGDRITFGEKADILTTFRPLTQEERDLLKGTILETYDHFITKVANNRSMTKQEVDEIGRGRVWTGSQAKRLGLVDETGGLSKAVQIAKDLAGIPPEEEVKFDVVPKKISLWDAFFGRAAAARTSPDLSVFDQKVRKVLRTFQMLKDEVLWNLMPFWVSPE
ncbi:MAG: signal peptide peptidase SppA [Candidatus Aminicenantes bacterium]|nr:signal peptide peptidase SppA [Candidatus Aminicenantes bacterium]